MERGGASELEFAEEVVVLGTGNTNRSANTRVRSRDSGCDASHKDEPWSFKSRRSHERDRWKDILWIGDGREGVRLTAGTLKDSYLIPHKGDDGTCGAF